MEISQFFSKLKGVKKVADGSYMALCPAHDEHEQSLSIKEADGKILLHCFAGCELADILSR